MLYALVNAFIFNGKNYILRQDILSYTTYAYDNMLIKKIIIGPIHFFVYFLISIGLLFLHSSETYRKIYVCLIHVLFW